MKLGEPQRGEEVPGHLAAILGSPPGQVRVRHVCAISAKGSVMRISERTPKSPLDFFLLNAARAAASAILTTGRILRDEPDVVHRLQGPPGAVAALEDFRRGILGRREPPWLAVLTSGRAIDPEHPAFAAGLPVVFLTSPNGERELRHAGLPAGARVVPTAHVDAPRAVAWLATHAPPGAVLIEAGPSAARTLYTDPCRIEELWLSRYLGNELPAELLGETLEESLFPPARSQADHDQPSGPWRFARHAWA